MMDIKACRAALADAKGCCDQSTWAGEHGKSLLDHAEALDVRLVTALAREEALKREVHELRDRAPREMSYKFPLRADLNVSVTLPVDLKSTEAARVARFLESLVMPPPEVP